MKYDRKRIEYIARVYGFRTGADREVAEAILALLRHIDELEGKTVTPITPPPKAPG